jgi:hypothetical protein
VKGKERMRKMEGNTRERIERLMGRGVVQGEGKDWMMIRNRRK